MKLDPTIQWGIFAFLAIICHQLGWHQKGNGYSSAARWYFEMAEMPKWMLIAMIKIDLKVRKCLGHTFK